VLLSTAQLPYTAHKRFWMLPTLSFSATKNSITAHCNMCHTQTPFPQTTTAVLSVGWPCTYTCAINISVATSQFSHCYLYSGMRKKMWGITFWATYIASLSRTLHSIYCHQSVMIILK
jgi:hypothetical protein